MASKKKQSVLQKKTILNDIFHTKPRRKGINSKQKGDGNELVACSVLKEWTGEEFVRVPRSGGLRWQHTQNICGDMISTNPDFDFIFSVETKHLKEDSLDFTLQAPATNRPMSEIWLQCRRDAERSNKIAMGLIRVNGMNAAEYVVLFGEAVAKKLQERMNIVPEYEYMVGNELIYGYSSTFVFSVGYEYFYNVLKNLNNDKK